MKVWNSSRNVEVSDITEIYLPEIRQIITDKLMPDTAISRIVGPNAVNQRPDGGKGYAKTIH